MKAITIRDKATGKLVACGPANGMYDPRVNALQTKQEEPDYETLMVQHLAELAALLPAKSEIDLLKERLTALEAKTV